jgi:hypothetical protein
MAVSVYYQSLIGTTVVKFIASLNKGMSIAPGHTTLDRQSVNVLVEELSG